MKSTLRDFSPGHWKVVRQADGTVSVAPSGYVATAWFAAIVAVALSLAAYFYPEMPFAFRILFICGTLMIGGIVVATFAWIHSYERRRQPYLVASQKGIQVRSHEIVSFDDCKSFEIRETQEKLADGWQRVYSLVLTCKSGKELEVVACAIKREIVRLKNTLDGCLEMSAEKWSTNS